MNYLAIYSASLISMHVRGPIWLGIIGLWVLIFYLGYLRRRRGPSSIIVDDFAELFTERARAEELIEPEKLFAIYVAIFICFLHRMANVAFSPPLIRKLTIYMYIQYCFVSFYIRALTIEKGGSCGDISLSLCTKLDHDPNSTINSAVFPSKHYGARTRSGPSRSFLVCAVACRSLMF